MTALVVYQGYLVLCSACSYLDRADNRLEADTLAARHDEPGECPSAGRNPGPMPESRRPWRTD